jgi:predicted lipid-binding transport protein (Tim44 family)
MNSESLKEVDKVIHESTKAQNKYYEFKQDRIRIGIFLLICSYSLIIGLIFLVQNLAIQQALIAIATLLILAALEVFKSTREDKKIASMTPSIKLDNRTFVYGDYNAQENISNYTSNQKQNLVEAAAEIQKLLNQISETHPAKTTQEKMVIATEAIEEIENSPTLKQRVISAFKAGSIAALENMLAHPAAAITVAALEGWNSEETEIQKKESVVKTNK